MVEKAVGLAGLGSPARPSSRANPHVGRLPAASQDGAPSGAIFLKWAASIFLSNSLLGKHNSC